MLVIAINTHCFSVVISACRGLSDLPDMTCIQKRRLELLLLLADRTMYAVHPIPLSEVKAIRKHIPSFGWQYIVLVLVNGLTLPPLYFGSGGVKALFAALKQVQQRAETEHRIPPDP